MLLLRKVTRRYKHSKISLVKTKGTKAEPHKHNSVLSHIITYLFLTGSPSCLSSHSALCLGRACLAGPELAPTHSESISTRYSLSQPLSFQAEVVIRGLVCHPNIKQPSCSSTLYPSPPANRANNILACLNAFDPR